MVTAEKVYENTSNNCVQIKVGNHNMQFGGGDGGDGFCYNHQSFDCELTKEEQEAVNSA